MKNTKRFIFLLIFIVSGFGSQAILNLQTTDSTAYVDLFASDTPLQIELNCNFVKLLDDISENRKYHDAKLSVSNPTCDFHDMNVKLRTRGHFRLRKQTCDFPPLKFKFQSDETEGTIFHGQDKLKYVSHCQNYKKDYELHTLEEFLIYRMYNLFTDYSYRVRLAQVNFIGSDKQDTLLRYGFFIEDRSQMANRIGRQVLKFRNIKQFQILRKNILVLSLFQCMIGNCDWDVSRLHNIDLLSVNEHSLPVAVPYDFDWSAIIGHEYFVPDPQIDLNSKYKRRYKSYKWSDEEFEDAFSSFHERRGELMNLVTDFTFLEKENRLKLLAYISEFYDLISSKDDVKNYLLKNARKIPTNY